MVGSDLTSAAATNAKPEKSDCGQSRTIRWPARDPFGTAPRRQITSSQSALRRNRRRCRVSGNRAKGTARRRCRRIDRCPRVRSICSRRRVDGLGERSVALWVWRSCRRNVWTGAVPGYVPRRRTRCSRVTRGHGAVGVRQAPGRHGLCARNDCASRQMRSEQSAVRAALGGTEKSSWAARDPARTAGPDGRTDVGVESRANDSSSAR